MVFLEVFFEAEVLISTLIIVYIIGVLIFKEEWVKSDAGRAHFKGNKRGIQSIITVVIFSEAIWFLSESALLSGYRALHEMGETLHMFLLLIALSLCIMELTKKGRAKR
ncbi:MAG: hypothetical protein ACE5PM_08035 [Candidatus Hydrothermarchaeales archaeon]